MARYEGFEAAEGLPSPADANQLTQVNDVDWPPYGIAVLLYGVTVGGL